MVKVGINGFGRIGKLVLRAGINDPDIEFVAANNLSGAETAAHLFKYDSVHGTFKGDVTSTKNSIIINGKKIRLFSERDPENLPWKEFDIDVAVESTGIFRTKELASKHLKAGAKKVLISAPAKGKAKVKTIVMGVNEHTYNKNKDHIVSNASCTTNCLAPVAKVLNDNFGIKRGFMLTVHAYTSDQNIVDASHKDLRRARAGAMNIVPTTTGAAEAVTQVIPGLKGCLEGAAMRVPVANGSIVAFTAELNKQVTKTEVDRLFKSVSEHELKGIVEFSDGHLVSSDIIGNPHSAIYDSELTKVMKKNLVHVVAWYDNEWGYSKRVIDVIKMMV